MFHAAAESIDVPMLEILLHGDPATLLARARRRAADGSVNEIKAKFSVNTPRYYANNYEPVLPADQTLCGHHRS